MDWIADLRGRVPHAASGIDAAVYALAAVGLNLQFGYTGLWNFGQAGFLLVGAYGTAIAVDSWGLALGWAVLVGIGAAVVLGLHPRHPDAAPAGRLPRDRDDLGGGDPAHRRELARRCRSHRRSAGDRRLRELRSTTSTRSNGRYGVRLGHRTRTATCGSSSSRGGWSRCSRRYLCLARPQPVGPRREGDPRGRGRGALARQERVRLQDAEPRSSAASSVASPASCS